MAGDLVRGLAPRLSLPVIAAPMTGVSGPALVTAACASGVVGAFPTQNTATVEILERWLTQIDEALRPQRDLGPVAPLAVNLVMRRDPVRIADEVAAITRRGVELVITSVGSPAPIVGPLHDGGVAVLADVATLRHAESALEAGVDGLVLLTAGAGGQTGWMNPFAYVRAVRAMYDGPIVLAGGVADGAALWAAIVLGCDLAYVGTGVIATDESLASHDYKTALVAGTLDDVEAFVQRSGLTASMMRTPLTPAERGPFEPPSTFSAGHTVSQVRAVAPVASVVERLGEEYRQAQLETRLRLPASASDRQLAEPAMVELPARAALE